MKSAPDCDRSQLGDPPAGPPAVAWLTRPGESAVPVVAGQSLLQALEAAGQSWPASCRNGTCRTCIGRLTEGRVRYAMAWPGLSADEKAEGAVLPCVARPLGDCTLTGPGL